MKLITAFPFSVLCAAALAQNPVDLSTWTAETYIGGGANWTLSSGNTTVTQSVNGAPTMFYSSFDAAYLRIEGNITVATNSDNDFIGFAIGFRPGDSTNASADYLLLDWKRATQGYNHGAPSCTAGSTANLGLALSRVEGVPTMDEFWGHINLDAVPCSGPTDRVTELQRAATLGSTAWVPNQTYVFRIEFSPNRIVVHVDGVLQIDQAGTFRNGRMAFYNFSQANTVYSLFTTDCLSGWNNYGTGFPGTLGEPTLAASAAPVLGTQIDIQMTSAIAAPAVGLLIWGWAETSIPSGFGGTLLAQPDVIEALLLPAAPALATRPLSIPLASVFCGMQVFTQLAHFDPGAAQGFAFSRGMLLNLGQ